MPLCHRESTILLEKLARFSHTSLQKTQKHGLPLGALSIFGAGKAFVPRLFFASTDGWGAIRGSCHKRGCGVSAHASVAFSR